MDVYLCDPCYQKRHVVSNFVHADINFLLCTPSVDAKAADLHVKPLRPDELLINSANYNARRKITRDNSKGEEQSQKRQFTYMQVCSFLQLKVPKACSVASGRYWVPNSYIRSQFGRLRRHLIQLLLLLRSRLGVSFRRSSSAVDFSRRESSVTAPTKSSC